LNLAERDARFRAGESIELSNRRKLSDNSVSQWSFASLHAPCFFDRRHSLRCRIELFELSVKTKAQRARKGSPSPSMATKMSNRLELKRTLDKRIFSTVFTSHPRVSLSLSLSRFALRNAYFPAPVQQSGTHFDPFHGRGGYIGIPARVEDAYDIDCQ